MPGGLADLLDVEGAHALLHAGRARPRRRRSPRKYGLNGTMPALTSSSVGSSAMSDAEGTTVWPLLLEVRAGSGGGSPPTHHGVTVTSGSHDRRCGRAGVDEVVAAVEPEGHAQLVLALGHALADVCGELADRRR